MNEGVLFIILILGAAFFLGGIMLVSLKIMNWHDERLDKRHRDEHPTFFKLNDDLRKLSDVSIHLHNKEIAPRMNQIDYIIEALPYLTKELRAQKDIEMENIREEIQFWNIKRRVYEEKIEQLREEIREYVASNNVEWAKEMGW